MGTQSRLAPPLLRTPCTWAPPTFRPRFAPVPRALWWWGHSPGSRHLCCARPARGLRPRSGRASLRCREPCGGGDTVPARGTSAAHALHVGSAHVPAALRSGAASLVVAGTQSRLAAPLLRTPCTWAPPTFRPRFAPVPRALWWWGRSPGSRHLCCARPARGLRPRSGRASLRCPEPRGGGDAVPARATSAAHALHVGSAHVPAALRSGAPSLVVVGLRRRRLRRRRCRISSSAFGSTSDRCPPRGRRG